MSAPTALAFFGLLVAVGIGLLAVMMLQEARTRTEVAEPTYVIADAIAHAQATVDDDVLERLRPAGVQRIIEWSVHYLQGLAEKTSKRDEVIVVAGGDALAVDYICAELRRRGHDYTAADISAVLATEAEYLHAIGAMGSKVEQEEPA